MPNTRETSVSGIQTVTERLPTQNLAKPWQPGCSKIDFDLSVISKCKFERSPSLLGSCWVSPAPSWILSHVEVARTSSAQSFTLFIIKVETIGRIHISLSSILAAAAAQASWYSLGGPEKCQAISCWGWCTGFPQCS